VVMLLRAVSVICTFIPTYDEPYLIASAVVLYESGKLIVGAQHPALPRLVLGAPLLIQGVRMPSAKDQPGERSPVVEYPGFAIGQDLMFGGQLPYWRMLISARLALLIFPALTMFFTYRVGRWLGGPIVAAAAVVFLSVDPTFLGHSTWVGTDSAGCAAFVAGIYYGLRLIARPTRWRAIVFGVVLGLAIACKYSCTLLIPLLLLVAVVRLVWTGRLVRRRWPSIKQILAIIAISFVVLWATFLFDVAPLRLVGEDLQQMFARSWLWRSLPRAVMETPVPMPSLWLGYLFLTLRGAYGHPTYLNGQVSFTGWWYYFPEALLVKSSLAFLAALAISFVTLPARRRDVGRSVVLLIPAGGYFAISMFSHYQLGIRHLLPILPLLYVFVAMQLTIVRRWRRVLIALIVVGAIETAWIHPDYLAFFNFAAGGPDKGERYLIDSNLDWGQDLGRLARWIKESPVARGRTYTVRAFNTSDGLMRELGIDPKSMEGEPRGLFAISKNYLHRLQNADLGPDGRLELGTDYTWVLHYPRVARIGYSIDVYDLDAKPQ
jgi:hypothetical protein